MPNAPTPARQSYHPMMDGKGPFGPIGMGGMFTMVKVRDGLAPDDYRDPGWYRQPAGTSAYEWQGELPPVHNAEKSAPAADDAQFNVRKPRQMHDH